MATSSRMVRCCTEGGGPAGMMLGLLLARAGVSVLVLEKHGDFLRDFRGDTIHPSTLELMRELGILDEFLRLPHQEVARLAAQFGDFPLTIADFSHLPTRCKFIALMPQWDFLDFLVRRAKTFPTFQLEMRAEAVDLIEDAGRVVGVRAVTPAGPLEVRADLVVAADGRSSVLRERAGLAVEDLGAPMDVFWFRLSRRPQDPETTMGRFDIGRIFVLINRREHWQCGYVIPKGSAEDVRRRGLDAFRAEVAKLAPWAVDRVGGRRGVAGPGTARRSRSGCWRGTPSCSACPRGWSGSASAPSTSAPRLPRPGQRSPAALYSTSFTTPAPPYWTTRIWR